MKRSFFCICAAKGSLSQGQLEFFCWQMYSKWEEKYFYSGIWQNDTPEKFPWCLHFLSFQKFRTTDANRRSSCEWVQNVSTLYSPQKFHILHIKTFSTMVLFTLVARSFVFHWPRSRKGRQTLSILWESGWEIRHTWKLRTTQTIGREKYISEHFMNISNFFSLPRASNLAKQVVSILWPHTAISVWPGPQNV